MKKVFIGLFAILSFASCSRFSSDYQSRLEGIHKVCPTCTYVRSEGIDYAQDTSKQPNIVYKVYFCDGFYYDCSTVDHLIRIN